MRCLPRSIRNTLLTAVVVLTSVAFTSCGTTCVAGIFSNGTGIILVKNSTPPPACPFSTGMGMMDIKVGKSQICEICTASIRAQHIYITLKSIQIRAAFRDSPNNPQRIELAPQLVGKPRQIDLVGDSTPTILVQSALIPGGTYRELLLQFVQDTAADPDVLPSEKFCGHNFRNCVLMADGHVEGLHFTGNGDSPELLVPLQCNGSSALAVVPGGTVHLQLTLQPQMASAISASEGWQIHYVLVGSASVSR